jgi:hypothetical protein
MQGKRQAFYVTTMASGTPVSSRPLKTAMSEPGHWRNLPERKVTRHIWLQFGSSYLELFIPKSYAIHNNHILEYYHIFLYTYGKRR